MLTGIATLAVVSAALLAWHQTMSPYAEQRAMVRELLNDPDSAVFRNARESPRAPGLWCGEVNARNKMGGMVGFTRYMVDLERGGVSIGSGDKPPFMRGVWFVYCED